MAVGEYQHLYWAFTKPGTYVFWAHAKGYPKSHTDGGALLPAGSKVEAVTSEVVRYKFHVGRMADLNVEVTSAEVANAGENVTLTVTARNNGPDDAPNTLVEVDLPDGLTYLRHNESAGEYHPDTGGWVIGDLASGALATLTITATVGANSHGQELKTKATISARERIGTSLVTELDPNTDDNMAMWTVIVTAESNVDPTFIAVRSVPENTAPESNVGNPIPVKDPDTANPRFVLTGQGAEDFAVINVAVKEGVPGAQIRVAKGESIDYERQSSYDLVLTVNDGKDVFNNDNSDVDDSIPVWISVEDDTTEPYAVSLRVNNENPTGNNSVTFTATVQSAPVEADLLRYRWGWHDPDGSNAGSEEHNAPN